MPSVHHLPSSCFAKFKLIPIGVNDKFEVRFKCVSCVEVSLLEEKCRHIFGVFPLFKLKYDNYVWHLYNDVLSKSVDAPVSISPLSEEYWGRGEREREREREAGTISCPQQLCPHPDSRGTAIIHNTSTLYCRLLFGILWRKNAILFTFTAFVVHCPGYSVPADTVSVCCDRYIYSEALFSHC